MRRIGSHINQPVQRTNEGAQIERLSIAEIVHANETSKRVSEEFLKLGPLITAEETYGQNSSSAELPKPSMSCTVHNLSEDHTS